MDVERHKSHPRHSLQAQHLEALRLKAVSDIVMEEGPEESFDRIARLLRDVLQFPSSLVSLIAADKQIFKSDLANGACFGDLNDNFCAIAVTGNEPLIVPDATQDAVFAEFPTVRQAPFLRAYWGVPLKTRAGFNVGTLSVFDFVPRWPDARDLRILSDFARVTIEQMELRAQATIDLLTGLQTRRAFQSQGQRLLQHARKSATPMACLAFDVDHFKSVNDRFGHAVGDEVLRRVGDLVLAHSRPTDLVGRIGGEEFAIVMPETTLSEAFSAAERLRSLLAEDYSVLTPSITASFGVTELTPVDEGLADLLERADRAAYAAKTAGRNRTCTT